MIFDIRRIYDDDTSEDHFRVLVDRLWPRGISKEKARIDFWAKEITPSSELRKEYHTNEIEYREFQSDYKKELEQNTEAVADFFQALKGKEKIVLLTSVKDLEHSHIPVLKFFLETYSVKQ
ncbi:MAG: DUF488 family protein [Cruoricaptor ignavus]|nr:DUF488 family protein [Cruoricaptor ignavus]